MARSLSYTPPTPPDDQSRDELDDLVRALHDAGLLRAMAGGARAYPQLLRSVLATVDVGTVRSIIALAGAVGELDAEQTERVARGIREARADAAHAGRGKPEGPLDLLRRLKDPDTRRGIAALLAALAAIGRSLPR
jgi:uncharacterized protein YjgD (DUF1641 family)